jgi:hypothetical protein
LPPALTGLLTGGEAVDEGQYGTSSYGSGERNYDDGQSGYDNNRFKFICINNNNNTVVRVGEEPILPDPLTCVECLSF